MNSAVIKTTILSIIFMGLTIQFSGILLLINKQHIAPYMRFLLPIPPIGVASYVFVYNMFAKNNGNMPDGYLDTFLEIFCASGLSFVFFFLFTLILVFMVDLFK